MKIKEYILSEKTAKLLATELTFLAVSSKVEGYELIKLKFEEAAEEQRISGVVRVLKALKREKRITLFVRSDEPETESTETSYLKNLYPSLVIDPDEKLFIVIKL